MLSSVATEGVGYLTIRRMTWALGAGDITKAAFVRLRSNE